MAPDVVAVFYTKKACQRWNTASTLPADYTSRNKMIVFTWGVITEPRDSCAQIARRVQQGLPRYHRHIHTVCDLYAPPAAGGLQAQSSCGCSLSEPSKLSFMDEITVGSSLQAIAPGTPCILSPLYRLAESDPHRSCYVLSNTDTLARAGCT